MSRRGSVRGPLLALLSVIGAATAPRAQTLEDLRQSLRDSVRSLRYGGYLATLRGLSDESVLSGARFRVSDAGGPETSIGVLSYPLAQTVDLGDALPALRLEADLGFASARIDYDDIYGGSSPALRTRVTSEYVTYGGMVGGGPEFALAGYRVSVVGLGGMSRVENHTDFSGPGAAVTEALTKGILYDFDATLVTYGAAALLQTPTWPLDGLNVHGSVRFDWRRTNPLQTDDPAQDTTSELGWSVVRVECGGPLGLRIAKRETHWSLWTGYKRFLDRTEGLLGFGDYYEVGGGLSWDCDEVLPLLGSVGLQASLLLGENVTGFSFGGTVSF